MRSQDAGDVDADQAWQELKILLDERVEAGKVSTKSVAEVLDEELAQDRDCAATS